jgi:hypothetical protein
MTKKRDRPKPAPTVEPLPDPMSPLRRELLEACNVLTECASVLSMVEHDKVDAGTKRANMVRFNAVQGRLKKLRKVVAGLEVKYNRAGHL